MKTKKAKKEVENKQKFVLYIIGCKLRVAWAQLRHKRIKPVCFFKLVVSRRHQRVYI